jgi:hypothetical protein
MSKAPPPEGYVAIEKALRALDLHEERRWVVARLRGVGNQAAQEAVALLRRARREEARLVLEAELLRLAGDPERVEGLGWFKPPPLEPPRKPLPWVGR